MNAKTMIFDRKSAAMQRGAALVDLLLTIALVAIVLPFIFNFQKSRIDRAQNIAAAKEMEVVRAALERYIDLHKKELLSPVGKNIARVKIAALAEYGAPSDLVESRGDDFQIRILKSQNRQGHSTLQGVVVMNDRDITPLRTREIINLGGDSMGFVEKGKAFGAFGTWHANASDMGIGSGGGIVDTTRTMLDQERYLWRLPSESADDATMLSQLNMGGHDIVGAKFLDAKYARFEEILKSGKIVADRAVFQTRATIDKAFKTSDATVAGTLSADSRGMEIAGALTLADVGKFTSFTADDLWVNNLNLSGLSVSVSESTSGRVATLKVNQTIDMVAGHVSAMFATVGFTGSITPKLIVKTRVEDSMNSDYFWDAYNGSVTARLSDIFVSELSRMASLAVARESGGKTVSGQIFGTVATNKNATAADFMNAISDIQNKVRAKYRQLNLE